MRVLLIANALPPHDLSGAGEQVVQLAWGLEAEGHAVSILGRGRGGAWGPKILFPMTAVIPALRRWRQFRPDLIQIHESDGGLVAVVVRLLRPLFGKRVLLVALQQVSYIEERRAVRPLVDKDSGEVLAEPTAAERRFRLLRTPWQIALGRLSAHLADRVMAPSAATAAELERDYGARNVTVLPNATGAPLSASSDGSSAMATDGDFVLFVGRLRIRKGLEVLLAALRRLRERGVRPTLLVVGDGERRAVLEQFAADQNGGDQVRFLGRRGAHEVESLLAASRGLVVPSTYEGMPLVILEAMRAGKSVVASRVSGIPEVVEDGATGWLVEPERSGDLATALLELWTDPAEADRRGEAGRLAVERRFGPRAIARQWLAAVEGSASSNG